MNKDKVQSVIFTFSDGTTAVLTGKAICFPGDKRTVTKIRFTHPKDLPDNYSWEDLSHDVETA